MNVNDAARRAGVSVRTIYRWISYGWLQTTHVMLDRATWRHEISINDLIDADTARTPQSLKGQRGAR